MNSALETKNTVRPGSAMFVEVTIPAPAAPATIWSLISTAVTAAGRVQADVVGVTIMGIDAGGNNRNAILVGHSDSVMKGRYAAGANAELKHLRATALYVSDVTADTTDTATVLVELR